MMIVLCIWLKVVDLVERSVWSQILSYNMFCLYFFLPLGLARVLYPDKATEQKFEEGIDQKMKSKMHSIVAKIPSFDLPPTQVANPSGISLASEPSSARRD